MFAVVGEVIIKHVLLEFHGDEGDKHEVSLTSDLVKDIISNSIHQNMIHT